MMTTRRASRVSISGRKGHILEFGSVSGAIDVVESGSVYQLFRRKDCALH